MTYNNWKNWETCEAHVQLVDDASLQEYLLEQAPEDRGIALENRIRQDVDGLDMGLGLADSFVQASLLRVDWEHLAEALCEEEEEEEGGTKTSAEIRIKVRSLKERLLHCQREHGLTENWGVKEERVLEEYVGDIWRYNRREQRQIIDTLYSFGEWCRTCAEVPR